jgi:hypothetical protein
VTEGEQVQGLGDPPVVGETPGHPRAAGRLPPAERLAVRAVATVLPFRTNSYVHGRPLPGLQHKYPETVLFFPRQGQTCHA